MNTRTRERIQKYEYRNTNGNKDRSQRTGAEYKSTSKKVWWTQAHEYQDSRTNKDVQVNEYEGEQRHEPEDKRTSTRILIKRYQIYENMSA